MHTLVQRFVALVLLLLALLNAKASAAEPGRYGLNHQVIPEFSFGVSSSQAALPGIAIGLLGSDGDEDAEQLDSAETEDEGDELKESPSSMGLLKEEAEEALTRKTTDASPNLGPQDARALLIENAKEQGGEPANESSVKPRVPLESSYTKVSLGLSVWNPPRNGWFVFVVLPGLDLQLTTVKNNYGASLGIASLGFGGTTKAHLSGRREFRVFDKNPNKSLILKLVLSWLRPDALTSRDWEATSFHTHGPRGDEPHTVSENELERAATWNTKLP